MDQKPEPQVHCPNCNSTQITANKKGFSGAKAVTGAVIAGPLGLAAGALGSNKIKITCLNCGHQFKPGEHIKEKKPPEKLTTGGVIVLLIMLGIVAWIIFG